MKIKNILIIFSLITSIMLFSGCTNYYENDLSLEVSLLVDQLGNALNITSTDFSPYPTLQEALDMFFTPNNTLTKINLEISEEERSLIITDGLMGHVIYFEKHFNVVFWTS